MLLEDWHSKKKKKCTKIIPSKSKKVIKLPPSSSSSSPFFSSTLRDDCTRCAKGKDYKRIDENSRGWRSVCRGERACISDESGGWRARFREMVKYEWKIGWRFGNGIIGTACTCIRGERGRRAGGVHSARVPATFLENGGREPRVHGRAAFLSIATEFTRRTPPRNRFVGDCCHRALYLRATAVRSHLQFTTTRPAHLRF